MCVCVCVRNELPVCSRELYQAFITKSHLGLMVPVHPRSVGLKAPEKCGKGPSFVKRSCSLQRLSHLTPTCHKAHLHRHIQAMLIRTRTPPRSFLLPPGRLRRIGWGKTSVYDGQLVVRNCQLTLVSKCQSRLISTESPSNLKHLLKTSGGEWRGKVQMETSETITLHAFSLNVKGIVA